MIQKTLSWFRSPFMPHNQSADAPKPAPSAGRDALQMLVDHNDSETAKFAVAAQAGAIALSNFMQPGQPHDRLYDCRVLWVFQSDGLDDCGFRVEAPDALWRWHTGIDVVVRVSSDVWAMCIAADVTRQAVDHLLSHIVSDGQGGYHIRAPQLQALLSAVAQPA